MKSKLFFLSAFVLVFMMTSCGGNKEDSLRDFVPGTYIRSIKNEFTVGSDSIIISVLDKSGGTYLIEHRSGYEQRIDGKVIPKVLKVEKWTGAYDNLHHQVEVWQQGKVFTFLPERNVLISGGGTEYKKVQ